MLWVSYSGESLRYLSPISCAEQPAEQDRRGKRGDRRVHRLALVTELGTRSGCLSMHYSLQIPVS